MSEETKNILEQIAAERARQIEKEGWTPEHDDEHDDGGLALAAVCYATPVLLYRKNEFKARRTKTGNEQMSDNEFIHTVVMARGDWNVGSDYIRPAYNSPDSPRRLCWRKMIECIEARWESEAGGRG